MPIICSSENYFKHVLFRGHDLFRKAFYINTLVYVFTNMQILGICIKKVNDLFVVDFQEATFDQELESGTVLLLLDHRLLGFYALEDVLEGALHDTTFFLHICARSLRVFTFNREIRSLNAWALNRVSFASTRLTIREDRTIIALHTAICDWPCNVVENRHLVYRRVTNEIEIEELGSLLTTVIKFYLCSSILNFNTTSICLIVYLTLVERPDPNDDFDIVGVISIAAIEEPLARHAFQELLVEL